MAKIGLVVYMWYWAWFPLISQGREIRGLGSHDCSGAWPLMYQSSLTRLSPP